MIFLLQFGLLLEVYCFFSESTTEIGTWLFLIGSIQLLIRPFIRIIRSIHLKRIN